MKGDITFFTVVEGLLVVGIVAYLVYLTVYARMIVQTIVEEENRERNALNFANALISHEKIVYEKEGVRYRGILNASKLDKLFHKSNDGLRNPEEFKNVILNPLHKSGKLSREQIDLGYSQTVNIIHIIDFDRCDERECVVWSGVILPVNTLNDYTQDHPVYKFFDCLTRSFDGNWLRPTATCAGFAATGGVIGSLGGPIGALIGAGAGCLFGFLSNLFSIAEVQVCMDRSGDIKNLYISETITKRQGLPVNIIYDDGTIHKGRVIVGFIEW